MKEKILLALLLVATVFAGCKDEILAPDISGIETADYVLNIGDKLTLAPNITNLKGNNYAWYINEKKVSDATTSYIFSALQPGTFLVTFKANNKGGAAEYACKIIVEEPISISFSEPLYVTPKMNVLPIEPVIKGPQRNDYKYEWTLGDAVIGNEKNLDFIGSKPGNYELKLTVSAGKQTETTSVYVKVEDAKYKASATSIIEYVPAPDVLWNFNTSGKEPKDYILNRDEYMKVISEDMQKEKINRINIGSWGSYVTLGFDHTIANVKGENDIKIGNTTFINGALGFYVAYDKNKNGKPDEDEWYMIKTEQSIEDYERTYTIGQTKFITESIWESCLLNYEVKDNKGKIEQKECWISIDDNAVATPLSFPGYYVLSKKLYVKAGWKNSYTIKGKMTPITEPNGTPNKSIYINIDNAVNDKGESVKLPGIDFLKIQQIGLINSQADNKEVLSMDNIIHTIIDTHL